MQNGKKFFSIVQEPLGVEDYWKQELSNILNTSHTQTIGDMFGDHWTSYGQKAGEKDGLRINYFNKPPFK